MTARAPWFAALRRRESFVVFVMLLVGALPGVLLYFVWRTGWAEVIAGVLFWPCAFLGGETVTPRGHQW